MLQVEEGVHTIANEEREQHNTKVLEGHLSQENTVVTINGCFHNRLCLKKCTVMVNYHVIFLGGGLVGWSVNEINPREDPSNHVLTVYFDLYHFSNLPHLNQETWGNTNTEKCNMYKTGLSGLCN